MSRYGMDGEPIVRDDDYEFDRWRAEHPDEWDRMLGRTPPNGRIDQREDK